jgi:hypothetical protein
MTISISRFFLDNKSILSNNTICKVNYYHSHFVMGSQAASIWTFLAHLALSSRCGGHFQTLIACSLKLWPVCLLNGGFNLLQQEQQQSSS